MIRAYIGLMGQGKTLSMVRHAVKELEKGRTIVTNTPFFLPQYKKNGLFGLFGDKKLVNTLKPEYCDTMSMLDRMRKDRNTLFLIDEASIVFSNYGRQLLDGDWIFRFAQVRKEGLELWYTTQRFNHVSSRLRELTFEIIESKKLLEGFFANFHYHPDMFQRNIPQQMRERYTLDREFIFPWESKKLYELYDTDHMIEASATITHKADTVVSKSNSNFLDKFARLIEPKLPRRMTL